MQTQPMGVLEHRETAREFLSEADEYFRQGDDLQGAEKMWGAAAHAVIAVCQQRGWRHRSHPAMTEAVERLAGELRGAGNEHTADQISQGFSSHRTIMFTSITGTWISMAATGGFSTPQKTRWNNS